MPRFQTHAIAACTGLCLLAAAPARAVTINLDNIVGLNNYNDACSAVGCPQLVTVNTSAGQVTIDGGVILTSTASLPADQTSVYGTADIYGAGLTTTITISFQNPVSNFLVDVLNGQTISESFILSDNAGNSTTFDLMPNTNSGAATIGFAATGTQVTLTQAGMGRFNFLIDNVTFDVPITCTGSTCQPAMTPTQVPEPATMALLGVSLLAYAMAFRTRGAVAREQPIGLRC